MGKNLKGRECGKGIYQRKDGRYSARYYAKDGKRKEKYFDTLPEAKNWLADARYCERHDMNSVVSQNITVDEWFDNWQKISFTISRQTAKKHIEKGIKLISNR